MKPADVAVEQTLRILRAKAACLSLMTTHRELRAEMRALKGKLRRNRAWARRVSHWLNPRLVRVDRRQRPRLQGVG